MFWITEEELDSWFEREILVHESALQRYLAGAWRDRTEVHDLRQETYVRVYEAAVTSRPVYPKAFLFATARYLMADLARRRRIVTIQAVGGLESLDVLVEENSPETLTAADEELRCLAKALNDLPPKCREVIWLRKIAEVPQKEIANRLGIAQKTVEKHVSAGIKRLALALHPCHPTDGRRRSSAFLPSMAASKTSSRSGLRARVHESGA
jgi:RNA polymerase sigma-70 factor (ECF subfamily)